jgi:hypothetical protein
VLPNFLVIGAQKTGTTSLWSYLNAHPQVFMSQDKEPNYFIEELSLSNGQAWYESLFAGSEDAIAVGEASTLYTMFPFHSGVAERAAALLPDAKIIYVMRDPIERMRSLYAFHRMVGFEERPIEAALFFDTRYVFGSMYAMQLDQWRRHYPDSAFCLVTSEELRGNQDAALHSIFTFLGVDPDLRPAMGPSELNTVETLREPRVGWRLVGKAVIRARLTGLMPEFVVRHNRHPLVARSIPPAELEIDKKHRALLAEVLHADLERLAAWMPDGFDGWGLLDR